MSKPKYFSGPHLARKIAKIVVGSAQGVSVTHEDVTTIIRQQGYVATESAIENVLSASLEILERYDGQLVEELSRLLPPWPTKALVSARARALGYELNAAQLKRLYSLLKSNEGLFEGSTAGTMVPGQHSVQLKSSLDQQILRALSKSTGLSRDKTISMVLRSFLQSFSVHHIDLATLVRTSTLSGDLAYMRALKSLANRDLTEFVADTDMNLKLTSRQLETKLAPGVISRSRPTNGQDQKGDGNRTNSESPLWQLLERLRRERERIDNRKWAWFSICGELGMHKNLSTGWKRGSGLSIETARKLATFFGVEVNELLFPKLITEVELTTIRGRLDYLLEKASIAQSQRLTWLEVQRQTGVRHTVISSVKAGQRPLPRNYAVLLGEFFDVDPDWIVGAQSGTVGASAGRHDSEFVVADSNEQISPRQVEARSKPQGISRCTPIEPTVSEANSNPKDADTSLWQLMERLRKEREHSDNRKWSWWGICGELGMQGSHSLSWKRGAKLRTETARKLATFFGVEVNELLFPQPAPEVELSTIKGRLDYLLQKASIAQSKRLTWSEVQRQTGVRHTAIWSVRAGLQPLSHRYAVLLGDYFDADPDWIVGAQDDTVRASTDCPSLEVVAVTRKDPQSSLQLMTQSKPQRIPRNKPSQGSVPKANSTTEVAGSPLWQLLERLRTARECRDKRKWSWNAICRDLGMSISSTIIKRGASLHIENARKLAVFFGVDVGELLFPVPASEADLTTVSGRLEFLLERASIASSKRLTWKEVQRETGVIDTAISSIKRGKRLLSRNYAVLLGEFFEVDPNWILGT